MDASFFLSGEQGRYAFFDLALRPNLDAGVLWPALLVICALLAHAAYTDIFRGNIIRNSTTLALFCLAVALAPLLWENPLHHLYWVLGDLVFLMLIYLVGAMKEGDIKLLAGLAVLLGPAFFFLTLISWIVILIYALPTMVKARRRRITKRGMRLGTAPGGPGIAIAFPLVLAGYGVAPIQAAAMIGAMALFVGLYLLDRKLAERYEQMSEDEGDAGEGPEEGPADPREGVGAPPPEGQSA